MKGISGAMLAFIFIFALLGIAFVGIALYQITRPAPVVVEYTGELEDAFLATEGNFVSDFTEQVDCNITDDILGKNYASCVYRTRIGWNATAYPYVDSKDWEFPIVIEVSGPVKMDFNAYLVNEDTGQAKDDAYLRSIKVYTHEDDPKLVSDLTSEIEDQDEIDTTIELPESGEYVFDILLHTGTISPDFATGDNILKIDIDLRDTESGVDVDEGHILVESA